ncbi:hypothetical protein [Bacillus sp. REN3]|uniref:hypothetical protein n=1 Tax=Bacillus sp. REN3 TaxID=2802440 RepID=UPI001AEDC45E|nr:hypothetical protein [Bacillus sp. REN3]
MKRTEFFKEMKNGFGETLRAICSPVIEEDFEKLSLAADRAMRIRWHYLSEENDLKEGVEQRFISGQPILVLVDERNMQAISGICPVCSNLLAFTPLYATGKCLICEKEYNFGAKKGSLVYTELPTKFENGKVYVGMST